MTVISLMTNDQTLTATAQPTVASGDVETVQVTVEFDEAWDGFTKSAVFYTKKDPARYEVLLLGDRCLIPFEVLAESTTLYIGVRGVNGSEVKTSTLVKYKIFEGAKTGDKEAQPPTPDVYQQLLNQYTAILQAQAQHKTETTNLITQYKAETAAEIAGYKADLDNQYDEAMAAVEGVTGAAQEALTAAAHAVEVAGNAVSLKPTTTIPNSSDLNTYITPGNFVVPSDEAAATISNIPIPNRGFLRVYGTNGSANVMQEYFRFSYGTRYTRLYTASSQTFSAWVCVSPTFALSGDELTISY